jgi:hypothetical protein
VKGVRQKIKKNRGGQRLKEWRQRQRQQQDEVEVNSEASAEGKRRRKAKPYSELCPKQQKARKKIAIESYAKRTNLSPAEAVADLESMNFSHKQERALFPPSSFF